MIVQLKKFGSTLVSRPSGKEALLAFEPVLSLVGKDEEVVVDFEGVMVLTPSWADEFLTPLKSRFGKQLKFGESDNLSVKETLLILGLCYNA